MREGIDPGYRRYVAIGDSQTEGLWDGDDSVGVAGFADRLAVRLDALYPGLEYANLAIRGKRVGHVLHEQLPPALAMEPDLITVCVGMNDVIQPGRSFPKALVDLDRVYAQLAASGATVVLTTFPNVAQFIPLGRLVSTRLAHVNGMNRAAAIRYGFRLVDLQHAPSMKELDVWAFDRVHASTKGHMIFADAAAEALGLPDSNHDWAKPSQNPAELTMAAAAYLRLRWAQANFSPWVWRRMRGITAYDGRLPKRPQLEPVTPRCAHQHEGAHPGAVQFSAHPTSVRHP